MLREVLPFLAFEGVINFVEDVIDYFSFNVCAELFFLYILQHNLKTIYRMTAYPTT